MTEAELQAAHKHVSHNQAELAISYECLCCYCLRIYKPSEVEKWVDKSAGPTAICPHCGIDAVLGDASGFALTPQLAVEMYHRWFAVPKHHERLAEQLELGATGEFPEGKLSEDDEGELKMALYEENGKLVMNFGTPVTWLALPPELAMKLGFVLLGRAKEMLNAKGTS